MQEDLEQRTVSVSIQAAKLSGRVLRAAIAAVLQKMEQERTMPKVGRNSMKRLTYKDPGANTIEVSGRIRSFLLLGWLIPAVLYHAGKRQSIVENLREL